MIWMTFDLCEQHGILSQSQALNSSHKLLHWNVISNHRISYTNTPCLCPGSTQSCRLSKQKSREPSSGCISEICTHQAKPWIRPDTQFKIHLATKKHFKTRKINIW